MQIIRFLIFIPFALIALIIGGIVFILFGISYEIRKIWYGLEEDFNAPPKPGTLSHLIDGLIEETKNNHD